MQTLQPKDKERIHKVFSALGIKQEVLWSALVEDLENREKYLDIVSFFVRAIPVWIQVHRPRIPR